MEKSVLKVIENHFDMLEKFANKQISLFEFRKYLCVENFSAKEIGDIELFASTLKPTN